MNNQTDVGIRFTNSVTGAKKVKEYAESLATIKSILSGIDTGTMKQIENSSNSLVQETKELNKTVKTAFNYTMIREFGRAITRTFQEMSRLVTKSSDFVENINLFQVAFDGNYQSAEKFVNKLTEMYGLDESWLTRTVGIFKQLSNAMALSTEQGTKLSTLLTQMSLDISSLYNVDVERASSTLQSALAGQTKPIRGVTGADITQNTLQKTLNDIGINRYIADLSYAEKRLLIVISLTRQLEEATNDYGRTIESPANQMRVLSEQWERLSRALGNLFLPIIAKVLPYLNAIMMVLTEIINTIAVLLGFNIDKYNDFSGISDSALELEESLGGAVENAKKLKQGLRGFDKLNVITTPSSSSASSGGGTGGIDPAIMDAFNDAFDKYNEKLTNVQMRATKIRDAIMEWLGFTKLINKETDDTIFKFEKITSGTVLGALAVGGGIYTGVYLISQFLAKIGIISKGLPSLFGVIKMVVGAIAGALGISAGWVVAIGVALVALVTAIIIYWDEIKAFVENLASTIATFFVDLWGKIKEKFVNPIVDFFTGIADFIYQKVIKPVIDFFKPIVEAIVSVFSLIISKVVEIVTGIGKAIWSIIEKIWEIFKKIVEIFVALGKAFYEYVIKPIWEAVKVVVTNIYNKAIKPILDALKTVATWIYENVIKPIWDKIVWLKDKAVEIFKKIGTTVVNFVSNSFKKVINGVLSAVENAINTFIRLLNKAIKVINKIPGVDITTVSELKIPRLEKGMSFVPSDYFGPVYLDYGERVLTKQENRDYNANQKIADNNNMNLNQTFIIQVGDEKVANVVLNKFKDMAKSNGKPITIG